MMHATARTHLADAYSFQRLLRGNAREDAGDCRNNWSCWQVIPLLNQDGTPSWTNRDLVTCVSYWKGHV